MFGAYILGAVLVGFGYLAIGADSKTPATQRTIALLISLFYLFLLVWGALHS